MCNVLIQQKKTAAATTKQNKEITTTTKQIKGKTSISELRNKYIR